MTATLNQSAWSPIATFHFRLYWSTSQVPINISVSYYIITTLGSCSHVIKTFCIGISRTCSNECIISSSAVRVIHSPCIQSMNTLRMINSTTSKSVDIFTKFDQRIGVLPAHICINDQLRNIFSPFDNKFSFGVVVLIPIF